MAIKKPTPFKIPVNLVRKALDRFVDGVDERTYEDNAIWKSDCLVWAENQLGMKGWLHSHFMPDARQKPEEFNKWLAEHYPKHVCNVRAKDRLRWLALGSKWADSYVRELGMLEHADEILTLHRARAVAKAESRDAAAVRCCEHLQAELADMWCILQMHRIACPEFAQLCAQRAWKFQP